MKNIFTKFALTAALIILSAGCQKDELIEPQPTPEVKTKAVQCHTLYYTIDGEERTMTYSSDTEWNQFMTRVTRLVRKGHSVTMWSKSNQACHDVDFETVTYTTTIEANAISWCKKMCESGYSVSIKFTVETKTYHCIARRSRDRASQSCLIMGKAMI